MAKVTSFNMKRGPVDMLPHCTRKLDTPAILFSTGHTNNYFHRISDVLIPLFVTSYHFNRRIIFLVADNDSRLTYDHRETLKKLSEHKVYNIGVEDEILCFSRVIVGLKSRTLRLSIAPSLNSSSNFSMRNFTKFLRDVYSLERASVHEHSRPRPRMLIITRTATRRLTNHVEVVDMARSLGFDPVAQEIGGSVASVAKLVNKFDIMLGVHGAGLTNMVFLPENAVVIQITPVGLDAYADEFFGKSQLEEMQLKYLEYKVTLLESSLVGKYPVTSDVYKHPVELCLQNFQTCKDMFLDNQDVNLDLPRFRKTLLRALDLFARAANQTK
ncbi:hypothetical protein C2S53_018199 [Perilla frutescens var. hirtella]|uniref:Glycosyltransferase 61 catalytic domain-containing protein n=1 Tax=Perilla frutescens var. hirtella TaxID=608512 RepID=A0AAD4P9H7_PERFH|nr:hypothetical protein C2S53_018199 [Perilla frutescens var. hirtella]